MSDFWIKLLALITAAASMLAQFEARWYPPTIAPVTVTQTAPDQPQSDTPLWIDACGTFHYYPIPDAALTPWYCAPPETPVPQAYP